MRIRTLLLALSVGALAACQDGMTEATGELATARQTTANATGASDEATRSYEITIENLSGGQPFTPPLAATHRRPADVFTVGEPASVGVQEIAENGNLVPLESALLADKHVSGVVIAAGNPPPVLPGGSITFSIDAGPGSKYLSWVSMLICTNDGFTGVDAIRLPKKVGDVTTRYTMGYDAGTEINTEDFADIVPPCPPLTGVPSTDPGTGTTNPALAEDDVIRHHPGIQGGVDLVPAIHSWTDPVARITVRRLN